LAKEGALMRDALLRDLSELNAYQLISLHDVSLEPSSMVSHSSPVAAGQFIQVFETLLMQVDLVWLIAPESDGHLLKLTELCLEAENKQDGPILLGCGYDACLIGTSKTLSYEAMQAAGIHTLPVHAGEDVIRDDYFAQLAQSKEAWLVKPEDGAGCEGIQYFASIAAMRDWMQLKDRSQHFFAQAYQSGIAASFCMLCRDGQAWLLSVNQQHVSMQDNGFVLHGISVNGLNQYWSRFETLARKMAKMLPDALAYVGVDVIMDTQNDAIYVIDINPRLTSSYVGLREAMACNPAELILSCVLSARFKLPLIEKNRVDISLHENDA
jgi:predicted ATP-grasp superfamily ATP-dependent carboligase